MPRIPDSQSGDELPPIIYHLAIDPASPSTLFAGTFGFGLLRSTDGGASWSRSYRNTNGAFTRAVAIDPAHPGTVYVGASGHILRSTDGGDTWEEFGTGLPKTSIFDLIVDPDRGTIYAATATGVYDFRTAVAGGTVPSACVPNEKTLCVDDLLGDRRFQVSLHFETHQGAGASGLAGATPLTSPHYTKGGVLYFFSPSNPEILVKVLDGCEINGHFWVYYAAATSVGFEMTVIDTETHDIKTYSNPDGAAARTVTDNTAFDGCP